MLVTTLWSAGVIATLVATGALVHHTEQQDPPEHCGDIDDEFEGGQLDSSLEKARKLKAPTPESTLQGEDEGAEFWEAHADLIRLAWEQWNDDTATSTTELNPRLPELNQTHIDPVLREAMEAAWAAATALSEGKRSQNDTKSSSLSLSKAEERLRQLWQPVAPGVFAAQLLNPTHLADLRRHLDAVQASGIPTRRPNGMNRYGYIVEPSIDGAVQLPSWNNFYHYLVNDYVRPLGRLLFPGYTGEALQDDQESYSFTIRYKEGEDLYLREHSDASLYTLNVNLNLPTTSSNASLDNDSYQGSSVYFVDEEDGSLHNLSFSPGMALLHRGMTRHAAHPITEGERTNWILWLYGTQGYVRTVPYDAHERPSQAQRWTKPENRKANPADAAFWHPSDAENVEL